MAVSGGNFVDKLTPRINASIQTVQAWDDDPSLLFECRALIPFHTLMPELYRQQPTKEVPDGPFPAKISIPPIAANEENEYLRPDDDKWEGDDLLLKRMTLFFQKSMTWVNSPDCVVCGCSGNEMKSVGARGPLTEEEREGGASRVEQYHCPKCNSQTTTFPRYNSVRKLLETRKGRCGEYANLFGLFCRAAGFETRYISDFTDHVWVEVYSSRQQRWIHADGCEGVIDSPSMYEAGWGKKLNYVIGTTMESVTDVTRRYTRKFDTKDFQSRRRAICGSEMQSDAIVARFDASQRTGASLGKARTDELDRRAKAENVFFAKGQELGKWMEGEEYKEGRISGSLAWRAARRELGDKGVSSDKEKNAEGGTTEGDSFSFFHVESFHPNPSVSNVADHKKSEDGGFCITITQPSLVPPNESIIVSGVPCAVGLPNTTMVVVVDEKNGCILQSRSFESWVSATEFLDGIPDGRLVGICAPRPGESDWKGTAARLARFGGLRAHTPNAEDKGCLLYVGQVNHHPEFSTCSADAVGVSVTIHTLESSEATLKLRTEHNTVPCVVSSRLPETVMPLRTQLAATEEQKRMAFLSFMASENAERDMGDNIVGYTTKSSAPVYLIDKKGFPLQRCSAGGDGSGGSSWNTFHYLPEKIVPPDDNGIMGNDKQNGPPAPKCDVPIDTSFFVSLLGPNLLVNTGGIPTRLDTGSALHNSRLVALYFSAHWCGPCRRFTPMLCELYTHLKEECFPTHGLEIVFVSSDRDPGGFMQYYGTMPWLAVPFENDLNRRSVSARFGVRGIPALVVLDAMSGEIVVTQEQSRSEVARACQGGNDAIEHMLRNQWLKRIPAESQAIMESLELSCQEEEADDGPKSDPPSNPYLVRDIRVDDTAQEAIPIPTADNQQAPVDPATRIKEIFASLVSDGADPTAAAANAIQQFANEQKTQIFSQESTPNGPKLDAGPLDDLPWASFICLRSVKLASSIGSEGTDPSLNVGESAALSFNDGNLFSNFHTPSVTLTGVRLLKHPKFNVVVGLQSVYKYKGKEQGEAPNCFHGPKRILPHLNTNDADSVEEAGAWVDAEVRRTASENGSAAATVQRVVATMSKSGLKDLALVLGPDSAAPGLENEQAEGDGRCSLNVPCGFELVGFHGSVAATGIESIGLVCGKRNETEEMKRKSERTLETTKFNGQKTLVDHAAARVASLNSNGKASVCNVISTAKKYLDNSAKAPSTPKFRTFKMSNKVFDRITSTASGVDLLRSLSFSVFPTDSDFMASIQLAADLDGVQTAMTRVLGEYADSSTG